jgi:hypothetical protein
VKCARRKGEEREFRAVFVFQRKKYFRFVRWGTNYEDFLLFFCAAKKLKSWTLRKSQGGVQKIRKYGRAT